MKERTHLKSKIWKSTFIGLLSFILGIAVMIISIILLAQSLASHRNEGGSDYDTVYTKPFKNSNWMKSSIPTIVISSFGIVLGTVQALSSLVLVLINGKFRVLAVVIWLGSHIIIIIFNIICFSLAISVKAHEKKESVHFWTNYQFQSKISHNIEGHVFCSLFAGNTIFILITVSILTPTLFHQYERPFSFPEGSF